MTAVSPSSLPSPALARRLADLCGEERNIQADFLLHLDEFDRRRAHLAAGYGSLWVNCLEVLHLRESAAGRRIAAMKVLRCFPALEGALRDGRLSLSTVNLLGPVLTAENLAELVGRAAFLSNAATEKLVVSIQPRVAPRDGVRKLPGVARVGLEAARAEVPAAEGSADEIAPAAEAGPAGARDGAARGEVAHDPDGAARSAPTTLPSALRPARDDRGELRPISEDLYSLRVTIDTACKKELDELSVLLSHTARGKLAAVLREAIRCGIAKHGKRKGAVKPERERAPKAARPTGPKVAPTALPPTGPQVEAGVEAANLKGPQVEGGAAKLAGLQAAAPAANASDPQGERTTAKLTTPQATAPAANATDPQGERTTAKLTTPQATAMAAKPFNPRAIPLALRRAVWERDDGRCAWTSPDGRRCGSRWKLELDHIDAAALGGPPTLENLRVACRPHNVFHAEETFGREHMAPYSGGFTPAGGSNDP